jgi:hypothetical protein
MREGCARLLGAPLALLLSPFFKSVYLRNGDGDVAGDGLTSAVSRVALALWAYMKE